MVNCTFTKIAFQLDKMQKQQKELERSCAEAERNGQLSAEVAQEVEDMLLGIHDPEEDAVSDLDNLEDREISEGVESNQRPRTQFPTYEGVLDQWTQFQALSVTLNKFYPTPEQQVLQLAAGCEDSIAKTLRHHTLIDQAMEDIPSRYCHPHLNMVQLLQNLKEVRVP